MGEWRRVRIGDVARQRKGTVTISDETEYKLCRVQLHRRGVILREKLLGTAIKTKKQQVCKAGDLIVAEMDAKFGGYGFIGDELDGAIVSSHYYLFDLDHTKISREYFLVLIHSGTIQSQIEAKGSTNYSSIRAWEFLNYEIPLPSLALQNQLASRFNVCFSSVATHDAQASEQLSLLKQLRQSVLQEAVEGKLTADWRRQHPLVKGDPQHDAVALLVQIKTEKERLVKTGNLRKEKLLPPIADSEKPFELPAGWVWSKLGELVLSAKDGPHFSPVYASSGIPFISTRNISPAGIDFSTSKYISNEYHQEISKRCKPEFGDILYTKGGTTGIARVNTYDIEFNVWVHVAVLKHSKYMDSFFIQDALNSPHCYVQSQKLTHGIGNQDLGLTRMINITVPLPPLAEQKAIITRVDSLMATIDALEAQVTERKEQAQLLMQAVLREAFAGGAVLHVVGATHASPPIPTVGKIKARRASPLRQPRKPKPVESLPMVAEPAVPYSPQRQDVTEVEPKRHAGHNMYNKAALAAYITAKCSDAHHPVGKVKVMKLYFLIQRKAEVALTESFVRRAAGPVDDAIHQALNLAGKQGWLKVLPKRGDFIPIFSGPNPHPAIAQVKKYFGESFEMVDQMLETMKSWGWEALERWATVEPLARELIEEGKEPTLAAIKAALAADPVWKEKLKKEAFSDSNIASTLRGLREFGFLSSAAKGQRQPAPFPEIMSPSLSIATLPPVVERPTISTGNIPQRILVAMQCSRNYSRAELLAATGISETDWIWAIRQLKEERRVVQTGEKRGARYVRSAH